MKPFDDIRESVFGLHRLRQKTAHLPMVDAFRSDIQIPAWNVSLPGELVLPNKAKGVVVFSHGSGSSRFSPRNSYVAKVFHKRNLGTVLIDLLTQQEGVIYEHRFDIDLLTDRLASVVHWLKNQELTEGLNIGLFGSSTGAASALKVASRMPEDIMAIVSRGGRPDLAGPALKSVKTPVLFIVGALDETVLQINRQTYASLQQNDKDLHIVPGATHLFEEPGKLDVVAQMAAEWFEQYLIYHG